MAKGGDMKKILSALLIIIGVVLILFGGQAVITADDSTVRSFTIIVWSVGALLTLAGCAIWVKTKDRNLAWALFGLLIPPFGLAVIGALNNRQRNTQKQNWQPSDKLKNLKN